MRSLIDGVIWEKTGFHVKKKDGKRPYVIIHSSRPRRDRRAGYVHKREIVYKNSIIVVYMDKLKVTFPEPQFIRIIVRL